MRTFFILAVLVAGGFGSGSPPPPTSAGGAPGGLNGDVQINSGGLFGAYTGTSCTNQFARSLSTGGVATCSGVGITDLTATGTPSATTFLRGDNTWSTPLTLPLSIANGGTNSSATPTSGGVGYGTGTAHAYSAAGTAGQVLTSNGAAAPTWQAAGGGSASACVTLGTATGTGVTVGPVIWTGTYNNLIIEYKIAGYSGGTPVGRILMGAASISTTALTNGNSMYEGVAGTLTNALSIPGAPLAVTLSNIARCGTMTVRGLSGVLKSYEIIGGNGNLSVSAARTLFRSAGSFSDLSTNLPIQRAQLTVYDTLTSTSASTNSFTSGTTITVIGCP